MRNLAANHPTTLKIKGIIKIYAALVINVDTSRIIAKVNLPASQVSLGEDFMQKEYVKIWTRNPGIPNKMGDRLG